MKKNIFYYSKKKLKYVEITNFYAKFVMLILLFSTIFSAVFLFSYIMVKDLIYPESDIARLRNENTVLKEKFVEMSSQINKLYDDINKLDYEKNSLRLSVNLDPTESNDDIGIGGYSFKKIEASSLSDINEIMEEVDNSLNHLNSKVMFTKNQYQKIEETLKNNLDLYKSIPAILPADGPVTDRFGMRMHPILKIRRMHTGIDILVNTGTNVYAPGDAKVLKVGRRGGYGITVELDHGFGYTSLYAHLSKALVKKGQIVKRGDLIGESGQTGSLVTGPHLHYEVKHNGVHLNPMNFVFDDIKVFDLITHKESN